MAERPKYNIAFNVCTLIGIGVVAVLHNAGIFATTNLILVGIIYLGGVVLGFLLYRIYRLVRYGDTAFFGE